MFLTTVLVVSETGCITSRELRETLLSLGLSQADFARLISVTPRAISLWMAGDRAVPGPVAAYAQLLSVVPLGVRQVELSRLKGRKSMRDGMYAIVYSSVGGSGQATLVIEAGRVFGADVFGGRYDGDYVFDEATGLAELRIKLIFPPNARTVLGVSHPFEWSVDVRTMIDPRLDHGITRAATPFGTFIDLQYRYLRGLPEV